MYCSTSTNIINENEIENGNPHHFLKVYKYYKYICRKDGNIVMDRNDGMYSHLPAIREWSVNAGLLHHVLDIPLNGENSQITSHNSNSNDNNDNNFFHFEIPKCDSIPEILDMVNSIHMGIKPKCRLIWLTPHDSCNLIHKYNMLWFTGDSLVRHIYQAFNMISHDDWQYGAFPLLKLKLKPSSTSNSSLRASSPSTTTLNVEKCGCDGQFSENLLCRQQFSLKNNVHSMNIPLPNNCNNKRALVASTLHDKATNKGTSTNTREKYEYWYKYWYKY